MSALTPKQENFCLAYLESGNASDAYRKAYDASSMTDASVNRAAKELMDNPKITSRIEILRAPVVEQAKMTVLGHLADLKELRDMARDDGKWGPAIAAEIARGKVSGFYVEKTEHSGVVGITSITRNIVDTSK